MLFTLIRKEAREDGIFGELWGEDAKDPLCVTLEHSYDGVPKLPPGEYTCVRGPHRLHSMTQDFETFEITGVPGHTNILFHWGNYNSDSDGCVLLGRSLGRAGAGYQMITSSRKAFATFMAATAGVDSFTLEVK